MLSRSFLVRSLAQLQTYIPVCCSSLRSLFIPKVLYSTHWFVSFSDSSWKFISFRWNHCVSICCLIWSILSACPTGRRTILTFYWLKITETNNNYIMISLDIETTISVQAWTLSCLLGAQLLGRVQYPWFGIKLWWAASFWSIWICSDD